MRWAGSIAALMICVLFGKSKAAALDIRYRIMHGFALDIRRLAAEMEYRPRDIKDMVQKLPQGPASGFWREFMLNIPTASSAEKAWGIAAKKCSDFDVLSAQELALIAEAGRSIGIMNAEDSAKMLKHWGEQAEKYAADLRAQSKSKGMIYQKLGLLGGLAVMLLIV